MNKIGYRTIYNPPTGKNPQEKQCTRLKQMLVAKLRKQKGLIEEKKSFIFDRLIASSPNDTLW